MNFNYPKFGLSFLRMQESTPVNKIDSREGGNDNWVIIYLKWPYIMWPVNETFAESYDMRGGCFST